MTWIILLIGGIIFLLAQFVVKNLFFHKRFYLLLALAVLFFLTAFFYPILETVAVIFLAFVIVVTAADIIFLFTNNKKPFIKRSEPERLSNGDENNLSIRIQNSYRFSVQVLVVDELPEQFQQRRLSWSLKLKPGQQKTIRYSLRPVERGAYHFGRVNTYFRSLLSLAERKFAAGDDKMIPVYPSFIQLRRYQLQAIGMQNREAGNRRLRKIGHSMEFEQVKEYVQGDDVRNLNWKATARKGGLMVNAYTDEKSQQVYCIIDKGRLMKMPFTELALLDYAINASLVLCSVALHRQDRFGLITFDSKPGAMLAADRKPIQLEKVLQVLYNQQAAFPESNFEALYTRVRSNIKHRSLLILFTNFESMTGLQRQLPYLKSLAKHHLLLVVFFENTELAGLADQYPPDIEALYVKNIAAKFMLEKQLIVKELQRNGILSILSPPGNVTVNTINKYIEIKTRQAL